MACEIERSDIVISAQFTIKTCVKLRYSPSIGIKTGQYCYLQFLFLAFFVLGLDVLIVKTCENVISDVKCCVCSDYRCSAAV